MVYLLLVILTVISCILFEYSKLSETLNALKTSYSRQFKVMSDKSISDEEKQKLLLAQISKQLVLLGKLILGIFLFVAPFVSLFSTAAILAIIESRYFVDLVRHCNSCSYSRIIYSF